MTKQQKQLVKSVWYELEIGGNLVTLESDVVKQFPEMKEEFELMCRLYEKFDNLFMEMYDEIDD